MIFHLPHGSVAVPDEWRSDLVLDDAELRREILLMTDAHVEQLYAAGCRDADDVIAFPVSRLVLDPERLLDDAGEPMAARGMGVVYASRHDGTPLRADLRSREALIARYYVPHHARLEAAVSRHLDEHGRAVIVDCHSFPKQPLPCDLVQEPLRPEICIGMESFHAPPSIVREVVRAFEREGYGVAVNTPFAGSIVPLRFHRREPRVVSVMIEVRRDLYMDERTGEPAGTFALVAARVAEAVAALRAAAWR